MVTDGRLQPEGVWAEAVESAQTDLQYAPGYSSKSEWFVCVYKGGLLILMTFIFYLSFNLNLSL